MHRDGSLTQLTILAIVLTEVGDIIVKILILIPGFVINDKLKIFIMSNSQKTLFVTDADLPVQVYVFVWISERREFVVEYRFEDDRASFRNFKRMAVVDRQGCMQMARFYNVKVDELPQMVYDECGVGYESTPSQADIVFQQVLDFILDSGVKYRLRDAV